MLKSLGPIVCDAQTRTSGYTDHAGVAPGIRNYADYARSHHSTPSESSGERWPDRACRSIGGSAYRSVLLLPFRWGRKREKEKKTQSIKQESIYSRLREIFLQSYSRMMHREQSLSRPCVFRLLERRRFEKSRESTIESQGCPVPIPILGISRVRIMKHEASGERILSAHRSTKIHLHPQGDTRAQQRALNAVLVYVESKSNQARYVIGCLRSRRERDDASPPGRPGDGGRYHLTHPVQFLNCNSESIVAAILRNCALGSLTPLIITAPRSGQDRF